MTRRDPKISLLQALALVAAMAISARAEEPSSGAPAGLTLDQAVATTLARNPDLALGRSAAVFARGRLEESSGAFDPFMTGKLTTDRVEQTLLPSTIEFEKGKRDLFRKLNQNLTQVADDLQRQLADPGALPILRCPEGIEAVLVGSLNICLSNLEAARREAEDDRLKLLIELAASPEDRARLEEARRQQLEAARPVSQQVLEILRREAAVAARNLENLGPLPETEERYSLSLDLRLGKMFRNGLKPSCGVILQGVKDKYVDKPLLAAFGGKGIANQFTVFEGCQVETPLLRGFGKVSTGAGEAAARERYRASVAQLGHAHSERALATIVAYWQAAAARDRRLLFERTVELEEKLSGDAKALVDGDEIPESELFRAAARLAGARQSLAVARADEIAARVDLATAMGLALRSPDEAPIVADPLPVPELLENLGGRRTELTGEALAARADLSASRSLEESARVLERAARAALKPSLDFVLQAGFFARHQSLTDDYYDYGGFRDAFGENHAGPSFTLSFKLGLPVGNRETEGRLVQARATRLQAGIRRAEISRRIGLGVYEVLTSLQLAADEAAARDRAAERYEKTLADTGELLRAGEATFVDTLLTEEQWTLARRDAIDARLAFALLSARLRFERGSLVAWRETDGEVAVEAATPYGPGL